LREDHDLLSAVLVDARIAEWDSYLDHAEGRFRAMHSTAMLIAELLPEQTASEVRRITADRKLVTVDDIGNPVVIPELDPIADILPTETKYLTTKAMLALDFDLTEVLAAVVNAVTDSARLPKGRAPRRDDRERTRPAPGQEAPRLAGTSFPAGALPAPADAARAASAPRPRPQASAPRPAARR
jgi:hypothetical protein